MLHLNTDYEFNGYKIASFLKEGLFNDTYRVCDATGVSYLRSRQEETEDYDNIHSGNESDNDSSENETSSSHIVVNTEKVKSEHLLEERGPRSNYKHHGCLPMNIRCMPRRVKTPKY